MRRRNTLTALCLLAALLVGFGLMLTAFFGGSGALRAELGLLRQDPARLGALLEGGAEEAANKDLDRGHQFIQLYGLVQRLTGRRVVEDVSQSSNVAKLDGGALNFAYIQAQPADCTDNALAAGELSRALAAQGVPSLFLLAPQKIARGTDPLPPGVRDYGNENADGFLAALEGAGGAALDLRPLFEQSGDYGDWFFRTDHHWRPEAAFYAWGYLAETLEADYALDLSGELADPALWDTEVLEDFFLGSQGKRVGSLYAGVDDFTVFTPKFDTDLTYTCPFYAIDRSGRFNESVCFPERVAQRDWFGGNPYTYYAGGDYPLATVVNHKNPDGPKILLIRDSFACALTPFLALSCGELTTVDLRYLKEDVADVVSRVEPDLVLTLYTAGTVSNADMFQYSK